MVLLTTSVVVLSAGRSRFLDEVLRAALANDPQPAAVHLVWSGDDPMPCDLPVTVQTHGIEPAAFDHGGTRQLALEYCTTELVVFLSDDAEPVDRSWLRTLTGPFVDRQVAATFGRQVPRPDASVAERVFRTSRYPGDSRLITLRAIAEEGGIALPISNANSAYRVQALHSLGGFPVPCAYGEDLAVALAALSQGWRVHYVAEAEVWHSHDLSVAHLFRRGLYAGLLARESGQRRRDLGFRFSGLRSTQLGRKMILLGWREARVRGVVAVVWVSVVRTLGYVFGAMKYLIGAMRWR